MDNLKRALERLDRDEKLDSPTLERLAQHGYINVSDVTNKHTPPGQKELLFISITEKGKKLLDSF